MAFTYDLASDDPTVARLSYTRLLLGDTIKRAGPLPGETNFSDEELLALIGTSGALSGAARAASALAARYAGLVDQQAGPLRKSFSQTATAWANRARALWAEAAAAGEASDLPTLTAGLIQAGQTEVPRA